MKKKFILLGLLVLVIIAGFYAKRRFYDPKQKIYNAKKEVQRLTENKQIQDGDLIFQTSLSSQSIPIQKATKSVYSHCGLIFKNGDKFEVIEAVQPVKKSALQMDCQRKRWALCY